jgi:hypothetical protein
VHVFRGAAADGGVIVVHKHPDAAAVGRGEAGRFGVVALLLGAVAAVQDEGELRMGQGEAVDMGPEVAEPAGAEADPGGQVRFGMAGQAAVIFAVAEERLRGKGAVQHREHVLEGHPVSGIVEVDGEGSGHHGDEPLDKQRFRDKVVGATRMAAQPLAVGERRHEHDRITDQGDVVPEGGFFTGSERCRLRVKRDGPVAGKVYGKGHGRCSLGGVYCSNIAIKPLQLRVQTG